jgi:hypothetical protein
MSQRDGGLMDWWMSGLVDASMNAPAACDTQAIHPTIQSFSGQPSGAVS